MTPSKSTGNSMQLDNMCFYSFMKSYMSLWQVVKIAWWAAVLQVSVQVHAFAWVPTCKWLTDGAFIPLQLLGAKMLNIEVGV